MSVTVFALTFQGKPELHGQLPAEDVEALRREAFPWSPPFNVTEIPSWRGYKLAPLPSGRLLVSSIANLGASDKLGRPVLTAAGCALEPEDLSDLWRDIGAVWRALEHVGPALPTPEELLEEVRSGSFLTAPERFERFLAFVRRSPQFLASASAALRAGEEVDFLVPDDEKARRYLQPVLLLCPIDRLRRLHLATGSVASERREPLLGSSSRAFPPPDPADEQPGGRPGLLGNLFGKGRREPEPRVTRSFLDFPQARAVVDPRLGPGPLWLMQLLQSPSEWPEMDDLSRFQLLLRCVDARESRGQPLSPLALAPELERLRKLVREIEEADREIKRWQ